MACRGKRFLYAWILYRSGGAQCVDVAEVHCSAQARAPAVHNLRSVCRENSLMRHGTGTKLRAPMCRTYGARSYCPAYPHFRLRMCSPAVWANLWSRLTALHCRSHSIVVCPMGTSWGRDQASPSPKEFRTTKGKVSNPILRKTEDGPRLS
jgi:hypothetical protein